MNYIEAIDAIVTRKEAIEEIEKHGIDPKEFFQEIGEKEEYIGSDVLNWLGY